jgi:hypothetical protein
LRDWWQTTTWPWVTSWGSSTNSSRSWVCRIGINNLRLFANA